MTKQELYLKTMFCCMACDGNIAQEEIDMLKTVATQIPVFQEFDVEDTLNGYIAEINQQGATFLRKYLTELSEEELTPEDELLIVKLALNIIESDSCIEYAEVKFFKKIRQRLSVSDEQILAQHPDKEDFLLPDITVLEEPVWNDNVMFATIKLT